MDGNTLDICIKLWCEKFIFAAAQWSWVLCWRCSPTQKALIIKKVKELCGKTTAAIGDGGNDIAMIQ